MELANNLSAVHIIGAGGFVGSTIAYTLAVREISKNIGLIDVAADLAHGQSLDITHAAAFSQAVNVFHADYDDIREGDVVIISAGIAQKPGQSRLELTRYNAEIVSSIVRKVALRRPAFLVIVTNPVDVMTMVALDTSGLNATHVFGSGTILDTARLRVRLAQQLGVVASEIDAFVCGEHGDSSFIAASAASVSGVPIAAMPQYHAGLFNDLEQAVRRDAAEIIKFKKATYYGVGNAVAQIVAALRSPKAQVLPVSIRLVKAYGVSDTVLSVPSLVDSNGAHPITKFPFNEIEIKALRQSAQIIRQHYEMVQKNKR